MTRNVSNRMALQHNHGFFPLLLTKRWFSSYLDSAAAGGVHSGTRSLTDQASFELRECAHYVKNKNTACRIRIDRFGDRVKMNITFLKSGYQID